MSHIRMRFAPSPTGVLHIGGARTALFNFVAAKQAGGQFLLRIEDTDQERSQAYHTTQILAALAWLGITHDQEIIYQTQRLAIYQHHLNHLLETGKAYRCNCSVERLDQLRARQTAQGQKPRYDGHCLTYPPDHHENCCVRLKTPQVGHTIVNDLVHGEVSFPNQELDDLIIQRTDGWPTYHFAVVVDDWLMQISHVIRGDDHLSNTPRQMHIIQALGAPLPTYAHLPMVLGSDGTRLSKRHGASDILSYHQQGFVAPAILNALIRLGWSHGDQEFFSLEEMIRHFSWEHVQRKASIFDAKKCLWLNQQWMHHVTPADLWQTLTAYLSSELIEKKPLAWWETLIDTLRLRANTLLELAEMLPAYVYPPAMPLESAPLTTKQIEALTEWIDVCRKLASWTESDLQQVLHTLAEKYQLSFAKLAIPLRLTLLRSKNSPSISWVMAMLGQTETLSRAKALYPYLGQKA